MAFQLDAQQKTFSVIDQVTGEPVPFANISIEQSGIKKEMLSNKDGIFQLRESFPAYIEVSCLGYKTFSDTLRDAVSTVVKLIPDVFRLDEVVVTGQLTPRKTDNSIYNVKVLSIQDIRQKAATSLGSLLSNEPDINIMQEGVLGRTLSMRGLGGEHVKILYNGIPVPGRQNGIIDLDQFSLHNADHIEIIEGPVSVIYGSNALGGVVNIISRQDVPDKVYADIGAHYESVGIYDVDFNAFYAMKNHQIGLHAARNFFAGFSPGKDSRFKLWKPKLQYIPGLTWSYRGDKINTGFSLDYLYEELRDQDSLSARNLYEAADDRYYYTKRLNTGLNINYRVSESSVISLQTGFSLYDKIKNSYHVDLVNLEKYLINDTSLQDTTRFRMVLQRGEFITRFGKTELTAGYDFNYEYGSGRRLAGEKTIGDYAFFATGILTLFPHLQFQPGVRYGYNTRYKPPVVYSLSLKYDPGDFRFRASYGKGFRIPSLKELFMEFIDQIHHVYGNSSLEAETAHNLNVSAICFKSFGRHNLNFKLDLYQNQLKNKIDFLYEFDSFGNLKSARYFNISGDNFKSRGFTFSGEYRFHPSFTFNAGLTHTGLSTLPDLNKLRYSTDYIFSMSYQFSRVPVHCTLYYKYTDKRIFYSRNLGIADDAEEIREDYINGYHNMDLTLSGYLFGQSLQMTAGVKNIFNNVTIFSTGSGFIHGGTQGNFPVGWGRSFFVKLNYVLRKNAE
jgi:outer membrane receptor for ferrienterochelin and colicins